MKRLYLFSYYQFNHDSTYELKPETQRISAQIISPNKTINISQENLKLVIEAMNQENYVGKDLDYLVALYSDIEVAIQEKKIGYIATQLGFECQILSSKPQVTYIEEEFEIKDISIDREDIISGDIYVINSHGKPSQVDGGFTPAIDNELDLERIVIDACSSATARRTPKDSKSIIAQVAESAYRANKKDTIEIIGYTEDFTTEETELTTLAIFAKKELILSQAKLAIITPGEIKASELKARQDLGFKHIQQQKQKLDRNLDKKTGAEIILRDALIAVCSKIVNHELIKNLCALDPTLPVLKGEEQQKEAVPETWMGPKNKFRDEQKHKFKQERKNYIHQLHENSLVSTAQRIIEKFKDLNIDEDFKNAVEALKQSIDILEDLLVNRSPVAKQRVQPFFRPAPMELSQNIKAEYLNQHLFQPR